VCYRPIVAQIVSLCGQLVDEGAVVVLIDNTELPYLQAQMLPAGCFLVKLGCNTGIARGLNLGLASAPAVSADVLLLLDQDSKPEPGCVQSLIASLAIITPEVVSPIRVNPISGSAQPALRLNKMGFATPVHDAQAPARYPVDVVISSGIAATRGAFDIVGPFDETLFIDDVDTEWCLRCRSRGIPIFVIPAARMQHPIGLRSVSLGQFTVIIHNPLRCYYQIRNALLLFRKPHVPRLWAATHLLSLVSSRIVLLAFVKHPRVYIKSFLLAIRDGLKGIGGARRQAYSQADLP
jgi:rhamnosyltransferase